MILKMFSLLELEDLSLIQLKKHTILAKQG